MNRRTAVITVILVCSFGYEVCDAQTPETQDEFAAGIYLFGVNTADHPHTDTIERFSPEGSILETFFSQEQGGIGNGRFSRNKARLALVRFNEETSPDIVVLDSDASIVQTFELAKGATVTAWSPDDSRLAFYEKNESSGQFESFVLDLKSGRKTKVDLAADYIAEDWHPAKQVKTAIYWNRRNRIYRRKKGDSYPTRQLDLLMSDGKTKPITKLPATDNIYSRFSPSGDTIAHYSRYLVGEKPFETTVVCNTDGTDRKVVFEFTKYGQAQGLRWFRPLGGPVWSPDASSLASLVDVFETQEDREKNNRKLELVIVSLRSDQVRRISLTELGVTRVSGLDWK